MSERGFRRSLLLLWLCTVLLSALPFFLYTRYASYRGLVPMRTGD